MPTLGNGEKLSVSHIVYSRTRLFLDSSFYVLIEFHQFNALNDSVCNNVVNYYVSMSNIRLNSFLINYPPKE